MHLAISVLLTVVLVGSLVYCVLVLFAARKFLGQSVPPVPEPCPLISVLKPVHGMDLGLEQNLRTFFTQDYPRYEILFATRDAQDPALGLIDRLRSEYPQVPVRVLVVPEPPYPNAKVWSLDHMTRAADAELLVMSDSDIRVDARFLRTIAAEFSDESIGMATCPYRAVAGPSIWSRLEAVGMNTEFWAGVLVARMLDGVKFTVGPTVAARKRAVEAAGGWDRVKDYLAEDFVLGAFAAEEGIGVILSRYVVEHRIGSESLGVNITHRVRWARSTRRSRPAGYVGQVFTNPVPLAVLLTILVPVSWPVLVLTLAVRMMVAYAVASNVLRARVPWLLLVPQDLLSFAFWVAGFFGNKIQWRGRTYRLLRDGRFELVGG